MGPDDYDAQVVSSWCCESDPEESDVDFMLNELCDSESDVEEKREDGDWDYGADWDSKNEVSETDFGLPGRAQSDNIHLLTGLPRSGPRSTPCQKPSGDVIIQDGPVPEPSSGGTVEANNTKPHSHILWTPLQRVLSMNRTCVWCRKSSMS